MYMYICSIMYCTMYMYMQYNVLYNVLYMQYNVLYNVYAV